MPSELRVGEREFPPTLNDNLELLILRMLLPHCNINLEICFIESNYYSAIYFLRHTIYKYGAFTAQIDNTKALNLHSHTHIQTLKKRKS